MYLVGPEFFIYSIIALIFGIFLGITIGVKIQPWVITMKRPHRSGAFPNALLNENTK